MRGPLRALSVLLAIVAVVVGILAIHNFYADDLPVQELAQHRACAGKRPPCTADLRKAERMPWRQSFWYRVGNDTTAVDCTRPWVLLGEVTCRTAAGPGVAP